MAASTQRAYRDRLRALDGVAGRPVDDRQLAEALLALGASRSPSWSAQAVAAARQRDPDLVGYLTARVLRHLRRDRARPAVHAVPIEWGAADRIVAACAAEGTRTGDRDAALIALMSEAMLRAAEASALDVGDVRAVVGGGVVTVRRAKTDQEMIGAELWISARTVELVSRLDADADGPLLRNRDGGRLSVAGVRRRVARRAAQVEGIAGATGHSLRVGSALELVRRGASVVECQQAGRWASPTMPARYARGELAAQGAVARLRRPIAAVSITGTGSARMVA